MILSEYIEKKNSAHMAKKMEHVSDEKYQIQVSFGRERLEDCIIRMLYDKEKNMKLNICSSSGINIK